MADTFYGTPSILGQSTFREDLAASTERLNRAVGGSYALAPGAAPPPSLALGSREWVPQQQRPVSRTTTREIGELPELPEYAELDEALVKSRTQEFSALGRREARQSFTDLLSRIYGATPDDPYAQQLARKASRGFSLDVQRAITGGAETALSAGLTEQQTRNQRRMTAYNAAVQAAIAGVTTTQEIEYEDVPMQWALGPPHPRAVVDPASTGMQPNIALTQPYTWGT